MEKDRSRGIKHIKDKQKYKGKLTKDPKHVPPKNKPIALATNWDRYDITDSDENVLTSSTDFELLANAPISTGGFYEQGTSKVIEEELKKQKSSSNYFCLDLQMLQKSVSIVPFYELINIDKKYFTQKQLSEMDEEAARNFREVEMYVKSLKSDHRQDEVETDILAENPDICSDNSKLNDSGNSSHVVEDVGNNSFIKEEDDNVISMINNLELTDSTAEKTVVLKSEIVSDDLEKWLDDILDD